MILRIIVLSIPFLIFLICFFYFKLHIRLNHLLITVIGALPFVWLLSYAAVHIDGLEIITDLQIFLLIAFISTGTMGVMTLIFFFRDPARISPDDPDIVLSPADGTIRYVKRCSEGNIPVSEKGGRKMPLHQLIQTDLMNMNVMIIGIEMSLFDVHVNRSPISGLILFQSHKHGFFHSLRNPAYLENERTVTLIENQKMRVAVIQIASRLVRRIVSYHKIGDTLKSGERIGKICFGSQVDIIIPITDNLKINIKAGQYVKAGLSVIATYVA